MADRFSEGAVESPDVEIQRDQQNAAQNDAHIGSQLFVSENTAELFQKIARQINLGPDATVTYAQILTKDYCLIDWNEARWDEAE